MEYFTINLDSDSEENVHVASSSNSSSDADGNNNVLDVNIKNLEARGSEDVKSVFSNVVDAINEDSTSSCPGNHPECELSVNQCAPCKVFLHKLTPERIALLALCTTSSDKVENIKEDIICLDTSDESDQEQQQTKCSEEPETKNVLKEILDLNKKDAVLNESKINKKQNTTSLKENNEPAPKSKALGWKSNIDEKVATKRAQSKSSEHQKFTSLIEKDVDKSKPVAVQSKPIEPGNSDSSGYRLGYCQSDEKSGDKMEQNSVISKVVVANSTSFSISSTSSYNTSNSSNKPTILPKNASISRRMSCFVSKSEAELKTKALSAKIKKPRRKSTIDKSTFSRAIDKIRPRHRSSTDDVTLDRSVFVKELLLKNRELRKEKLKELAARESAEKKEIEMRAIQSGTIIVEKLTANNRCAYRTMMPAISDSG